VNFIATYWWVDLLTIAGIFGILVLCGYLILVTNLRANRPKNLLDLDREIIQAQARLDYLLQERAHRFSAPVVTPTFQELRANNERMDND
jgi:hypothetical protein